MRITLTRKQLPGLALACASLLALPCASFGRQTNAVLRADQIGHLEQARTIIGSDLKNAQNQPLGKINDVVVDLESGRILYTIATVNGATAPIAVPPSVLSGGAGMARPGILGAATQATAKTHILNFDQAKLNTAPKFTADQQSKLGDIGYLSQVYQFYGTPGWWEGAAAGQQPTGSFNNVQKVSALFDHAIKDVSNADFGKIDDVVLDLRDARVPFVLLLRPQGQEYAIPPNAFTLAADKQTLTTGLDQNTLTSAPQFTKGNLQMLANRATANAIYQHYGKQPYFGLTPTSNDTNTYVYPTK